MPLTPSEAFRRYDETPDEEFYSVPRLVTHIDDRAIAAVTQLYRELFPPGGGILDLMSSWVSHLPEEVRYERVVGLGMNEEELRRNPRLDEYVVQNLNREPKLPFTDAQFDGVGICVSIDYLTNPVAVLREVGRVLKVGAPVVVTFSKACEPPTTWTATDPRARNMGALSAVSTAGAEASGQLAVFRERTLFRLRRLSWMLCSCNLYTLSEQ